MKRILIGIALAPFVVLIVVLALPILVVMEAKDEVSLRIFRRREAGHVYLICTSRRNWHDFLKNNVIPILPDNFRVVWYKPVRGGKYAEFMVHLARSHIFCVPKPYMVAVTPRALVHRSLNSILQELKAHPKKSTETRQTCAEIITQMEKDLRTTGSTVRV